MSPVKIFEMGVSVAAEGKRGESVMRRKQCEVTEPASITEVLRRCTIGRLGTIGSDGYPYIVPVNYVYWNGAIYFHCSKKGEKIDNILRDNKVCFEVDIPLAYLATDFAPEQPVCSVHQFYHSVIVRGKAEVVENIDEKVASLNALMASHENSPDFSAITAETSAVASCAVVAVRVESMSGKSDLAQKKSDEHKSRIAEYLQKRNLPGDEEAARLIRP
jgi:nitroimidazol reductase NimA-like FMN-containing flavoprotein (pyridoxamine 5'-phosphate oxidase superfamily)